MYYRFNKPEFIVIMCVCKKKNNIEDLVHVSV